MKYEANSDIQLKLFAKYFILSLSFNSQVVYNHLLIDLDMDVFVHMEYVNGKHVPTDIHYKGFWNVLFFKPERAEFKLKNTNFLVN